MSAAPTDGRLILTLGDPSGVGPEVACRAMAAMDEAARAAITVVGPVAALERAQRVVGTRLAFGGDGEPGLIDVPVSGPLPPYGTMDPACGDAAYRTVVAAVEAARGSRVPAALVTGPLNKEAMNRAGHLHDGHTGLLAHLTAASQSWMLLTSEHLSVVHVSTHVPLAEAVRRASRARVLGTIRAADAHLRRLGIAAPRIAVAGLNPHCGENGLFGSEDDDAIAPAVADARVAGIDASGPIPPDTVFRVAAGGAFDVVVAQYHDQGHIPMKMIAFETTVNVTLGLPVDRASVDHGTAFDIAGTGRADHANMLCAIRYGERLIAAPRIEEMVP